MKFAFMLIRNKEAVHELNYPHVGDDKRVRLNSFSWKSFQCFLNGKLDTTHHIDIEYVTSLSHKDMLL